MNPKLEFFKIKLRTRKSEFNTFRDFCVDVLGSGPRSADKTIFGRFLVIYILFQIVYNTLFMVSSMVNHMRAKIERGN